MNQSVTLSLVLLAAGAAFGCPKSPSGTTPTASASASASAAPSSSAADLGHGEEHGAGSSSAPTPAPVMAGPSAADLMPVCTAEAQRELTCKDDLIPALVDVRIKLDLPKGIAAAGKDKAGRDKLIAQAKKEIAEDHAADKIQPLCERRLATMPAEARADAKSMGEKCNAEKDCKAFTACVMPMIEKFMPKGEPPSH